MSETPLTSLPKFRAGDREWTIKLTLATVDAVQLSSGVDLLGDDVTNVLVGLLFDQRKLGAVLAVCCHRQAESLKVDREAFFDGLDSDALTAGWGALCDAVVFFTPPHRRETVKLAIEKQMLAVEQGAKAMRTLIDSPQTDERIHEAMQAMVAEAETNMQKAFASSSTS